MSRDLIAMAEKVYADISSDGKPAPPLNPCPACGKESVEHTPDPVNLAPRMICCFDNCRHIVVGVLPKR